MYSIDDTGTESWLACKGLGRATDRYQMRLGVEHESTEVDFVSIVTEQQVEILERFAEEEGLHHVTRSRVQHVLHIAYWGVSVFDASVRLKRLEYRPTHVLVSCVSGQRIKIVQTLDEFRAQ